MVTPPHTNGVSGVKVGQSTLTIPAGTTAYNAPADWYFPTQADGSVAANGVIWLQHGFLANNSYYSSLATTLAQKTNSIVVAPSLPSFPSLRCFGCTLYGVPLQQGAASMFTGDEAALNFSANQAGYLGTLPQDFVLAGHSAGGGWSVGVGGYYADSLAPGDHEPPARRGDVRRCRHERHHGAVDRQPRHARRPAGLPDRSAGPADQRLRYHHRPAGPSSP